jgi:hypothetical protein
VRAADDDVWLSIKVAGADVTGPLAFLLLFGGIYAAWSSSTAAKARQQQGRWVYDRSLGGKKVGPGGICCRVLYHLLFGRVCMLEVCSRLCMATGLGGQEGGPSRDLLWVLVTVAVWQGVYAWIA